MRDLDAIQDEAIANIEQLAATGVRSAYVDWATGTGKTTLAAKLAARRLDTGSRRVLFLAERTELLTQTRDKFAEWADLDVAIEQGHLDALSAVRYGRCRVVAASVASFHPARLARWPVDTFDDIIVDEAHHYTRGSRYDAIIGHFDHRLRVNLTATPDRADGRPARLGVRAHRYWIGDAIRNGHLLPIRVRKCATGVDLRGLRACGADWTASDIESRVNPVIEPLARAAVKVIHELGIDRFVGFAPTVQSSFALADALDACGVAAVGLYGSDPQRAAKLAMLDAGHIRGIINCATLTEGWDARYLGAMLNLRPTKSVVLERQMVGRITRPWPGMAAAWVIEPTWLDQSYDFAAVADALADEDESAAVRAAARMKLETGATDDPLEALDEARAELAERWEADDEREYLGRLKLAVTPGDIAFHHLDFDPIGVVVPAAVARARDAQAGRERVRRSQREALGRLGLPAHPLATRNLSRAEAQAQIDLWTDRGAKGLASYRQVRELEGLIGPSRVELPAERLLELTAAEADELIRRPLLARSI